MLMSLTRVLDHKRAVLVLSKNTEVNVFAVLVARIFYSSANLLEPEPGELAHIIAYRLADLFRSIRARHRCGGRQKRSGIRRDSRLLP